MNLSSYVIQETNFTLNITACSVCNNLGFYCLTSFIYHQRIENGRIALEINVFVM